MVTIFTLFIVYIYHVSPVVDYVIQVKDGDTVIPDNKYFEAEFA